MDVILENRNKLQAECEDMYKALGAKMLELHAAERRFITNQFELCGIRLDNTHVRYKDDPDLGIGVLRLSYVISIYDIRNTYKNIFGNNYTNVSKDTHFYRADFHQLKKNGEPRANRAHVQIFADSVEEFASHFEIIEGNSNE